MHVPGERKYRIITTLTLVLTVILLGSCIREPFRMRAAAEQQRQQYVAKGAAVYAQNCVQCHGPRGEGSVGMPLNRAALRMPADSAAGRAEYDRLYQTIWQGRPGNLEHPRWVRTPDGKWLSFTAMPAAGKAAGGSLDEEEARALTLFIMAPGGSQWALVGDAKAAPFDPPSHQAAADGAMPLPDAQGVDPAVNSTAKALLMDMSRVQCLTCHMVGSQGAKTGPDLTRLGSWGVDQAFVEQFIKYGNLPAASEADRTVVPHDQRMPVYWMDSRPVTGPETNLQQPLVSEGPYYMTRFQGRLTDEEVAILAQYLMGLK
jgi:mono/diheme cytochrome c family protein